MTAPAGPQTRTPWPRCLSLGPPRGPWCTPSPISLTPHMPSPASHLHTTSSPATATPPAARAASTAKVCFILLSVFLSFCLCLLLSSTPAKVTTYSRVIILPSGSRSSGSTRSEGERRRSTKGPGSTVGGGEKSPSGGGGEGGGADSRSGSGSESEYSTRSSLRRGHGSSAPSEHSHASSQRSHHHRMPQPPHMSPYPPGILPYNPMMVMMVPQHPHPNMATAHVLPHAQQMPTGPMHPALPPPPSSTPGGPPGAPPTRDLGSVPPELTASRQSFHLAMGNPSEFFVDVM